MKTLSLLIVLFLANVVSAQTTFSYDAQKQFIPKDLGKIYLGMTFKELADQIPLGKANADGRFDFLQLEIPFEKGDVTGLTVRIHGLTREEIQEMIFEESTSRRGEDGEEYDDSVERIDLSKIPAGGIVYSLYIGFKPTYDLKSFVVKKYGKDGEVRKPDDQYHFFDIQWTKKTPDGLTWLIRSFHEGDGRSLQLLGRIEGTEWGID